MDVGAVVVHGAEGHTLIRDLHELSMAKDLKATRVCEDGSVPAHERMKAAHVLDEVGTGTLREVVGIGKQDPRADGLELVGQKALYRSLRPHWHEDGGGDVTMRRVEHACAGVGHGILRDDVKAELSLAHGLCPFCPRASP